MGEANACHIASISPLGASGNVIIEITGAGFNPIAPKNVVVFTREGVTKENAAVTISSVGGAGAMAELSRIGVAVPEGLPPGAVRVKVVNTVTGETIEGGSIELIGITLSNGAWAQPGSSVDIRITGTPNVRFVADGTVTAFGEGVKVNYETVESDTSIVANVTVSPDARAGARSIGLMTESQVAVLLRAFTVKESPVRFVDSGDAPGSFDDSGAISYIFAPFDEDKPGPPAASTSPAVGVKPAGPKDMAPDVGKVAGGVAPEEPNPAKAGEGQPLSSAEPKKTGQDPEIEAKTPSAAKAKEVNYVASEDAVPLVISLKDGEAHVSIVASPEALSSVAALKPEEKGDAEKITLGPAEKEPFEGVGALTAGELDLAVKDLKTQLAAEIASPAPQPPQPNDEEEGGVLKRVLVAFLGPFMLIGYLISHLWNY